ncbi:zinc-binding dehydrogenase [Leifsonia sp. NPDC056665]|uniref:zinc-dependent alcohol dehydrogenase n=1 Tax=Leifsonia sp. NPDC056665 TaxID=3345901 RepID=UPI003690A720
MAATSRAMVLERPGSFVENSFEVPLPNPDEFVLRVDLVTICGGDLIEYAGGNRKAKYPLLMGHEVVGTVVAIGDDAVQAHKISVGDRVSVEPYLRCGRCDACRRGEYHFCSEGLTYGVTIPSTEPPHLWGGYSQYFFGAPGARVHKVAASVPDEAAVLTSVLANGVRWVRTRGQVRVGEGVLVTGLGVQALASIIVASLAGASPIVVACRETDESRLALAREYGADLIFNTDELQTSESSRAELRSLGLAVAIECTGAEEVYRIATDALAFGGRMVSAGTRGGKPLSLDLDAVVFKELTILGGLGQAGDTELAAEIVNSGRFAVEKMVTHRFPLSRVDDAIQLSLRGEQDVIHIGLDPWAEESIHLGAVSDDAPSNSTA